MGSAVVTDEKEIDFQPNLSSSFWKSKTARNQKLAYLPTQNCEAGLVIAQCKSNVNVSKSQQHKQAAAQCGITPKPEERARMGFIS